MLRIGSSRRSREPARSVEVDLRRAERERPERGSVDQERVDERRGLDDGLAEERRASAAALNREDVAARFELEIEIGGGRRGDGEDPRVE
jgi:hypothetical protein